MAPHVMILDDDVCFARSTAELARTEGYQPHIVHSLDEARGITRRQAMDLILLDLELPDGSGLDLLDDLDFSAHGQMAIVTGNPSLDTAALAVSTPIIDYLIKPLDPDKLISVLRNSLALSAAGSTHDNELPGVIARSDAMRAPINLVKRVAPSEASIFLEGETGTGKEVFALAIHELSGRTGRFVAMNCGATPAELLASQLFGHERGSFTGAVQRHVGVFEQAMHGTLLLDEITEMPMDLQVYLLRVLETGTVRRVGANDETTTPVRVLAATNRDPLDAIAKGQLREDLYYRLADFTISLPPLRQRDNDVAALARHFVGQLNARYGLRKYLCPRTVHSLQSYSWPGNVRELRSAVQRAYLLTSGDQVSVTPGRGRATAPVETDDTITFPIGTTWAELERRTLLKVLAYCAGDKTAAAKMLGVSVRTIHNHLSRLRQEERAAGDVGAHS